MNFWRFCRASWRLALTKVNYDSHERRLARAKAALAEVQFCHAEMMRLAALYESLPKACTEEDLYRRKIVLEQMEVIYYRVHREAARAHVHDPQTFPGPP